MKKKLLTLLVLVGCLEATSQKVILLKDFEGDMARKSPATATEFKQLLNGGGNFNKFSNGKASYQSFSAPQSVSTDLLSFEAIKKSEQDFSQVTLLKINLANTKELSKRISSLDLKSFPSLQYIVIEAGFETNSAHVKSILPGSLPASITVLYQVLIPQ